MAISTYELWDAESGNLIGCFDSIAAALQCVREIVAHHGSGSGTDLLLGREDETGRSHFIAKGVDLEAMAVNDA